MSELKVDKITPRQGTTLTLGDSGDTINFGSGVLPNFENLTVTGDLTVDTNSLKVDSTNNFVGIGTATPAVALDVVGAITATGNITGTLATAAQPNITSLGTLTSATVSGDLTVDTDTLYVDSTNNRVGILTTNPSTPLHIQKSALTGFISRTASNLTLESSGGNEIYFASGDSSYGQIRFGDTASTYSGGIQYEHNADHMLFVANGSEKMRIGGSELVINENSLDYDFRVESDTNTHALFVEGSSGNVTFGTNTATNISNGQNAGIGLVALNYLAIARDGGNTAYFNRLTSDGDIVVFRKDGTTVGSIGTLNNDLYIGTGDTTLSFIDGTNSINPTGTSGAQRSDLVSLGDSNNKFKDLYLSGTVTNDGSGGMSIDTSGNVTFNEGSIDADFRVESNNNTHALFVDGGNDMLTIGGTGEGQSDSFTFNYGDSGGAYLNFNMDGRASPVTGVNGAYIYSGQGSTGDYLAGSLILQSRSNNDRNIQFVTGSTPAIRMIVDGSGQVLVGTDSNDDATDGFKIKSNGQKLTVTRDGAEPLVLNRRTSDGDILKLRIDNTEVGTIGTVSSGNLVLEGNTSLRLHTDGQERLILDSNECIFNNAS